MLSYQVLVLVINYFFNQERVEEIPTLDGYIGLKLSLERLEWRNKVAQRQRNIENLKKQNERARKEKERQQDFEIRMNYQKGRRPSPNIMTEVRRKERIDLNMPSTTFGVTKAGVSSTNENGQENL